MGGPPGGGAGGPGGGMEAPKLLVRWESSLPVREASIRAEELQAKRVAELAAEYYVVSTSGMQMMGGRRGMGAGEDRPQPDFSRMQDRMKEATSLTIKGKPPIRAERIEVVQAADGMVTLFLFPRSTAISADDKEVAFETAMGPMEVKSKFYLKDMMFDGNLAL